MMTLVQWFEEKGIEKEARKGVEKGMERRIEKGTQQGRQEVSQEFVPRLLSKGMPWEDVAEMANLPLVEVDRLIN